jgi:hypothetical protein
MQDRKTDVALDKLVEFGHIAGYHYTMIEDEPGSGSRETERLVLIFNNGFALKINTFCSGSAENTVMEFDTKPIIEGFDD